MLVFYFKQKKSLLNEKFTGSLTEMNFGANKENYMTHYKKFYVSALKNL